VDTGECLFSVNEQQKGVKVTVGEIPCFFKCTSLLGQYCENSGTKSYIFPVKTFFLLFNSLRNEACAITVSYHDATQTISVRLYDPHKSHGSSNRFTEVKTQEYHLQSMRCIFRSVH